MSDKMIEVFEAWFNKEYPDREDRQGKYRMSSGHQIAISAWQAALASQPVQANELSSNPLQLQSQPVQASAEPVAWKLFKQSLYVGMRVYCARYLMSNAHGRWDGAEKAQRHMELCQHIIASVMGCEPDQVRRKYEEQYQAVHTETRKLTDNLDEEIGFPLDSRPDYDALEPKFFDRFFELSMGVLNISPGEDAADEALKARIAELENSLKELVSIVKIHQKATSNNFAWAELEVADEVLKGGAA